VRRRRRLLSAAAGEHDSRGDPCAGDEQGEDGEQRYAAAAARRALDPERRRRRGRRQYLRFARGRGQRVAQLRHELRRRGRPLARILGERPVEHGVELGRQLPPLLADRRHARVGVRRGLGGRRIGLERPRPGEELPGDDGERVDVGGGRRALAQRLLGREVAHRAEHRAGERERVEPRRARDPEVGDVDVVRAVEQQVRRLHVAVDDAVPVSRVEGGGGLLEPGERLRGVDEAARPDAILDRAAAEVLHDDERALVPLADVVDRDGVRLAREPRGRERLAHEATANRLVLRVALGEDLDGDGAAERRVGGAVDVAHAAVADPLRAAVALGQEVGIGLHGP
jgi:hypothetical protein